MKQSLYLGFFATIIIFFFPVFTSEYYRESIITGLMFNPQLRVITLTQDYGYTLNRSQIKNIIDVSYENQDTKAESYMAVFDQEDLVTYSYFHRGPDAGQLLVYLKNPTKKPLKGQAADFNYLKKQYLESKTFQK